MTARNILLIFFLSLFYVGQTLAQDLNNFEQLVSKGEIPKEIVSSSKSKYKALEKKKVNNKKPSRKVKKFHLESSFAIDQLLKSGNVLFGDPVSEYVNKVADKLLENEPKLRKKLRFYVVRSTGVNAFATDRGSIFVNIGLISKLETEAQLAFILAHEIIHYQEKHNMDSFLEYQEIDNIQKRKRSFDKLLEKSNYSQHLEKTADEEGMEIFALSPYGNSSISGVFDILSKSHTAFSDIEFDKSYLEILNISIPDSMLLDSVSEIVQYMDSEELSSHPSLKDRKEKMGERFPTEDSKPAFIQSETDFTKIRDLSRFEACNILIQNKSYSAAIYYSYVLSKEFPENNFVESIRAKALYGYAQYVNDKQADEIPLDFEDIQGNMQQAFYVLSELSNVEISTLAAAHLWKYHKKNPKDEAFRLRTEDMVTDLIKLHVEDEKDFFTVAAKEGDSFVKGKFVDIYNHSDFQKIIKKAKKERKSYLKMEHRLEYLETLTKNYKKDKRKERKEGVGLGKKNMIFINPMYVRVNKRKRDPVRYVEAEEQQEVLVDLIEETAPKLKLKASVLDVNSLSRKSPSEEFNEIVAVNNWVDELSDHSVEMIPSNHKQMLSISEKYDVEAITYVGVLSLKERSNFVKKMLLAYMLPSGYLTPLLYQTPMMTNNSTAFFWLSIDVEELKILNSEVMVMKMKSKDALLQSNIYWMMEQIKRKK